MNQMEFENKTAIVTGAGQGIGFAICEELLRKGASVVLNDVDEELAQRSVGALSQFKGKVLSLAGDSSDVVFINRMVHLAVSTYGKLDLVVANAGITLFGDFFNYTQDAFKRVMQVNLEGTFFLAQAAARQMVSQGGGGSILFMSSVTGHQAHKDLAAYSISKAAVEMLAKNLVIELSPFRISVNAIAPGATSTERTMEDVAYNDTWSKLTPMGRPASVSDIAHAALFLLSDKARHITGQSLVIDGGWSSISPSPFE